MNICWITRAAIVEREGRPYSGHAAVRMRALMPADELRRRGHQTRVLQLPDDFGAALPVSCEVAVLDQLLPVGTETVDAAGVRMLALIAELQRDGAKVVADIHDDHFSVPGKSVYFRALVQAADAVTASTWPMAQVIAAHSGRPVHVIGDPYEGPRGQPQFAPVGGHRWLRGLRRAFGSAQARRLELAWFGHQSNLHTIYDLAQQLAPLGKRWPMRITLVCASGFGAEDFSEMFNHYHGRHCRIAFSPWSLETTWQALRDCDLAVIPSAVERQVKQVKSANRLIEILQAGKLPVAHPLPAYQPFAAYAWIGADIAAGIEW